MIIYIITAYSSITLILVPIIINVTFIIAFGHFLRFLYSFFDYRLILIFFLLFFLLSQFPTDLFHLYLICHQLLCLLSCEFLSFYLELLWLLIFRSKVQWHILVNLLLSLFQSLFHFRLQLIVFLKVANFPETILHYVIPLCDRLLWLLLRLIIVFLGFLLLL